jgi:hypothetical protein
MYVCGLGAFLHFCIWRELVLEQFPLAHIATHISFPRQLLGHAAEY